MIGRKAEPGEGQDAKEQQESKPATSDDRRLPPRGRQRYTKADGDTTLSFRPSQVGVHSIAARRREHQVAAEWDETHSAWERQMASLRDSINDERQAAANTQNTHSEAAAATVNAFLAETEVLQNVRIGRPAPHGQPSDSEGAGRVDRSDTSAPNISPLSARLEDDGQHDDDDEDALMDAILLEAG